MEIIDESTVVCYHDPAYKGLAYIEKSVFEKVRHEISLWYAYRTILLFAKECAARYLASGGKLEFDIYGLLIDNRDQENKILCSYKAYIAFRSLLLEGSKKILSAQRHINTYLSKVGLKVINLNLVRNKNIIQVIMKLIDI